MCVLLLTLLSVAPAFGSPQRLLGLSTDGNNWSSSIPAVLPTAIVVPGDQLAGTFHLRNLSGQDAFLRAVAVTADGDRLISDGWLDVRVRLSGGTWQRAEAGEVRIPRQGLKAATSMTGTVRVVLRSEAGNQTQDSVASVGLRLTLSQNPVGVLGAVSPEAELPATGAAELRGWLVGGAGLLGAGLAVVLGRRRTSASDQHIQGVPG